MSALRTSRSMTSGHVVPDDAVITQDGMPLGYLYASWNVEGTPGTEDEGFYDEEAQIWVSPDGGISMGVYTKTRTSGSNCGDCVTDDACA